MANENRSIHLPEQMISCKGDKLQAGIQETRDGPREKDLDAYL